VEIETRPEMEIKRNKKENEVNDDIGGFELNEKENESKLIFEAGMEVEIEARVDIGIENE
jgi:hypothetical protein